MGLKLNVFLNKKILVTSFFIFILIISQINITAKFDVDERLDCFGFIVPLPQGKDTKEETFQRSNVTNLINDLMREKIEIFQGKEDFSANVIQLNKENIEEMYFSKGAYIIPFSGDEFKDAMIISIVCDYNQTHELNSLNEMEVKIYALAQKLNVNFDRLNAPKIVQQLGKPVRYGWPTYLKIAESGGFFDYECMLDGEAASVLNNEDFNIIIWPYLPGQATILEQLYSMTNIEDTNAIRNFVNNGGGYIGTCQGAIVASAGLRFPGVLNSLRLAYQPYLKKKFAGTSLSISDTIMWIPNEMKQDFYQTTIKIIEPNHPLFYGLNSTFHDMLEGPLFSWVGKNTRVLGIFKDIKSQYGDQIDNEDFKELLIDHPSWVNSKFGNGEVILFTTHPDFINNIKPINFTKMNWSGDPYYGRRIIYNSFFYVTSDKNKDIYLSSKNNKSYIDSIFAKTNKIKLNDTLDNCFEDLIKEINKIKINLTSFKNKIGKAIELFKDFLSESKNFPNNYNYLYTFHLSDDFLGYLNNSIKTLLDLEKINSMIKKYNETMIEKIKSLKIELYHRLNRTNELLKYVIDLSTEIEKILTLDNYNLIHKTKLYFLNRYLLNNFEILFKHIPQIHFDSQKIIKHFWYNFEANISIN